MRTQQAYVAIDAISSYQAILSELSRLDKQLPKDGLERFIVFNNAYYIVTDALMQAAGRGYFKHPEFVEQFTVCFASYYFAALNSTVSQDPNLPTAWKIFNKITSRPRTPQFVRLLMGANAHINHDLPLVLLKRIDESQADDLFKDILQVDKLLMRSGRQILTTFDEPNHRLDMLKRRFIFLYYRPVMYMILYWRIGTWHDYKSMKKHGIQGSNYTKRSIRIAHRFAWLAESCIVKTSQP